MLAEMSSVLLFLFDISDILNISYFYGSTVLLIVSHTIVIFTSPGFDLTTLVVIGTDFTGSGKSNYHTITTAP
jgi:hypothetical protein